MPVGFYKLACDELETKQRTTPMVEDPGSGWDLGSSSGSWTGGRPGPGKSLRLLAQTSSFYLAASWLLGLKFCSASLPSVFLTAKR